MTCMPANRDSVSDTICGPQPRDAPCPPGRQPQQQVNGTHDSIPAKDCGIRVWLDRAEAVVHVRSRSCGDHLPDR